MDNGDSIIIRESDEYDSNEDSRINNEKVVTKRANFSETRPEFKAIDSKVMTPRENSQDSKNIIDNLPIVHIKLDEERRDTDVADFSSNQKSDEVVSQ